MDIQKTLIGMLTGVTLASDDAEEVFEMLLTGGLDDAQIASVLTLIQSRGVTVEELTGAARAMRRHVTAVPTPPDSDDSPLIDTCGTGGAPKTFNVSTAAAIVAAAASPHHTGSAMRIRVAKHGNRSRSGRGSSEVLALLGVNVDASPGVQARCLERAGICFCFAIHHHPAMRFAIGPRRSLGFPTVFNLLGPLTNPAGAHRQVLGVYDAALAERVAHALSLLGATRAMVVHGTDGMDEISTAARTIILHVRNGSVATELFDPDALGIRPPTPADLIAGDLEHAAETIRHVLAGEPGPRRDIVLLNAAAALIVAGAAGGFTDALEAAAEAIDSGRAARTLTELATVSHDQD